MGHLEALDQQPDFGSAGVEVAAAPGLLTDAGKLAAEVDVEVVVHDVVDFADDHLTIKRYFCKSNSKAKNELLAGWISVNEDVLYKFELKRHSQVQGINMGNKIRCYGGDMLGTCIGVPPNETLADSQS